MGEHSGFDFVGKSKVFVKQDVIFFGTEPLDRVWIVKAELSDPACAADISCLHYANVIVWNRKLLFVTDIIDVSSKEATLF